MPNTRALHRKPEARHVAIIMDGNGRWALRRGMPRLAGHAKGVERLREVLRACPDLGITHLTLYAFSTENWKRPAEEVAGLMRLFRHYIKKESARLVKEGVRIRFIGNRDRLDADLGGMMGWLEELTAGNTALNVTVAIDYGGRDEILRATRRAMAAVAEGRLDPAELDEARLGAFMDTAGLPDPDLVLRTSGEVRISNFLLWQAAYAEYEFLDICWPDFTAEVLAGCIERYGARERRFGAATG
ncbi:di-trans,poly-cis-decaprenylcistransferase [Halovulum dunhuangense]|uniref:Isoprenyl transferase n=1 Tax=Halovulum dunhuangense TaxID=1505036 RepID=A0A849L379_9RHOB|nr:polyprenyl diphosphate synthase [Halovulum dunhuangense]NNU80713.1 di-trans,poly-cis-decaprenylcistransferase [Halovulum dunhuangense]